MTELLVVMALCLAPAAPLAILVRQWRPEWSRARVAGLAAAPVAGPGLLLCVTGFAIGLLTPAAHCPTDACAMGMVAAWELGWTFLLGFVAAAGVAAIPAGRARRP